VPTLLDRSAEREGLDGVLEAMRAGLSGALVLVGEAGVGKSALLEYAVASAADMDVLRATGIESEMDLGFAALHQLLMPILGRLERLPAPQREALGAAFGLVEAARPDLFLVGLATLTLLADAASERPVLCVVDDAQWVDQASARVLPFVARRLLADRVGMLFAFREEPPAGLEGLTELRVEGLPSDAARQLLESVTAAGLERRVAERIVLETRGNPLALVELGGELNPEELSSSAPLGQPLPIGRKLEERFLARVRRLPVGTQTLLLLAAAQDAGDPAVLWRAAKQLGIGVEAASPPELERFLAVGPEVAFRHPLMRSAVYHGASPHARRQAHDVLAAAIDPELDPDRRAWHRAEAAVGPDEEISAELERSAERAGRRGGLASQAVFLERAAGLSTDDVSRYRRLVAAAEAEYLAGAPRRALELLDRAAPYAGGSLEVAKALALRARTTFFLGGAAEAASYFVRAALAYERLDIRAARDITLEGLRDVYWAGPVAMHDAAMTAKALARVPEPQTTTVDLLVDGFAELYLGDWGAGAPLLHEAIARVRAGEQSGSGFPLGVQLTLEAWWAAMHLCDLEGWHDLVVRFMGPLRDIGALTPLAYALDNLGVHEGYCGRFDRAEAHLAEGRDVMVALGTPDLGRAMFAGVVLLAYRGREAQANEAAASLREVSAAHDPDRGARVAIAARAELCVLDLSLGNYRRALAAAHDVFAADPPFIGIKALPDLVEAACRVGEQDAATAGLTRLQQRARASGTPWALGLLARSQALLADEGEADELYREAITQLRSAGAEFDLARAHLLFGEALRRQRRRRDARDQLRAAHEMFDTMGADAFAERARKELLATGEHAHPRTLGPHDELTPQEDRVARLAAEGASNIEIAAQLFVSQNTVEYHLRKVFRKLSVSNRTQLARSLQPS
jgi:DNA-binding CsgD family transcriptional regulator